MKLSTENTMMISLMQITAATTKEKLIVFVEEAGAWMLIVVSILCIAWAVKIMISV